MSSIRTSILLTLSLTAASVAPALAQSSLTGRYATDPDARVYSRLATEHRALAHTDAVLPQTSIGRAAHVSAVSDTPRYATDPDPAIYGTLAREHIGAFAHTDAVLPRTTMLRDWRAAAPGLPLGGALTASEPGFNPAADRAKGSL